MVLWRLWTARAILTFLACVSVLSIIISYHLTALQDHEGLVVGSRSVGERGPRKRGILSREPESVLLPRAHQDPLLTLLTKMEERCLKACKEASPVILVRGQKLLVSRDLPAYSQALSPTSPTPLKPAHTGHANSNAFRISSATHSGREMKDRVPEGDQNSLSRFSLLDTTEQRVRMVAVNGSVYYAMEDEAIGGGRVGAHDWRVLVCLTYTDGDSSVCLPRKLFPLLGQHQKVGRLPGLRGTVWRRESLCDLLHSARLVSPIRALVPACYALPAHHAYLTAAAHALPDTSEWVVKAAHSGRGVKVIDNRKLLEDLRDKRLGSGEVVQVHWGPPLQVLGATVSVRLYLLITSLQPLRAHVHTHGEVMFRHLPSRGYAKIQDRVWSWTELVSWVGRNSGEEAMRSLVGHTEAALTALALAIDLLIPPKVHNLRKTSRRFRCEGCYQLLGVDLIYNSTYHPAVMDVTGQPDLSFSQQEAPSVQQQQSRQQRPPAVFHPSHVFGRSKVTRDMLQVLLGEAKVAQEVNQALVETADNLGVVGIDCLITHDLCLTQDDLDYLIQTRRESGVHATAVRDKTPLKSDQFQYSTVQEEGDWTRDEDKRKEEEEERADDVTGGGGNDVIKTNRVNQNDLDLLEDYEGEEERVDENAQRKEVDKAKIDQITTNRFAQDGFTMIYPSPIGRAYDQVIADLYHAVSANTSAAFAPSAYLLTESWRHTTRDLHNLVTSLEAYHRPLPPGLPPMLASLDLRQSEDVQEKWLKHQENRKEKCMEDPATAPYLQRLTLVPELSITPAFTPLVTSYWAEVNYELITIQVSGLALHCQAEARLEDKFGPSTLVNYTLGLGDNRVNIAVVDIGHSEPWTLNTYTIHITRRPPPRPLPDVTTRPHQVCALKQECELRVSPSEPCGLSTEPAFSSWAKFIAYRKRLAPCTEGDASGRWVVACKSCLERDTCDWSKATWQPFACTHQVVPVPRLQRCLKGRTLVFLGDSTNRGMLYALLERVNGTLTSWDKTHDLKVITGVNSGQTTFAFAYYPQFWLPSNQRPVFDKTLYKLLLRSGPLRNSTDTVVIVGGVHWVAAQHLHMVANALEREGLQGAQVVLKTLGAGFHVSAPGVHTVSLRDHSRLLQHSMSVAAYAHHRGYQVVDTFNMTTARYRHFLQGKCACHFHKVVTESKPGSNQLLYHVEGEINAIYTNILANAICQNYVPGR
ncbi:cadherin-like and PC-esterase domain-containing protein 1 [Macrobrachium rosenbergii]|uniref:cadherin-like and PC-esterase domain-containing protein 1 n=1 Tax=Macrobrachium rosenbergii TaxID=79674 RepID=UPI0034D46119